MSRLRAFWRLLNQPCRQMTRLASESLDRDLTRWERIALRSHVIYCRSCRRYLRQIRLLRRAMSRLASDLGGTGRALGCALPEDVRDRIKRALHGDI